MTKDKTPLPCATCEGRRSVSAPETRLPKGYTIGYSKPCPDCNPAPADAQMDAMEDVERDKFVALLDKFVKAPPGARTDLFCQIMRTYDAVRLACETAIEDARKLGQALEDRDRYDSPDELTLVVQDIGRLRTAWQREGLVSKAEAATTILEQIGITTTPGIR